MEPQKAQKLMGVAFFGMGSMFAVIGAMMLVTEGRDFLIIGVPFMLFGLLFAGGGSVFLFGPVIGRWRRRRIIATGIAVNARVTAVRTDTSATIGMASPSVIDADYNDVLAGQSHSFTSHRLWVNPREAYPVGSQVTVYYLPGKPKAYAFDLQRLWSMGEVIPAGFTRVTTEVPLPKDVEVEETPDGVRYLLPNDAAILLSHDRLQGWSTHGRKRSRPARRVRRLLIWQLGIVMECDGWYGRTHLVHFLPFPDASDAPSTRLLTAVALDLAKRMESADTSAAAGCAPAVAVSDGLAYMFAPVPRVEDSQRDVFVELQVGPSPDGVPTSGFVDATIRVDEVAFPIQFGEATITQFPQEYGGEQRIQIGVSRGDRERFRWEDLDDLIQGSPFLHFRINGEPTLREVEYWFSGDPSYVGNDVAELPLGLHVDGPIQSVEPVWVENGEHSFGRLPVREVPWGRPQDGTGNEMTPRRPSSSEFVEATIPFQGKAFLVRFSEATVVQYPEEDGGACHVEIGVSRANRQHFSFDELEELIWPERPYLHLRINDDELHPIDLVACDEPCYVAGQVAEIEIGFEQFDRPVHSIELIWVEDGEQSLGRLPVRKVAWVPPPEDKAEEPEERTGAHALGCIAAVLMLLLFAGVFAFALYYVIKINNHRPREQAAKQEDAKANAKSGPGEINLMLTADHSASSVAQAFDLADAFDGDPSTRWLTAIDDNQTPWLAARWEKPVTIHKIVVRESYDRIIDFVIERYDEDRNGWVHVLYMFGRRHSSSYSQTGEKDWGYIPDAVLIDGKRIADQKQRVLGQNEGRVNPVFTINLPYPMKTTGLRFQVKDANTKPNRRVSIFEIEAY